MATLHFMQACFPYLRDASGCVVNMGSGSSILPQGAMSGYAMTKEAVRVLPMIPLGRLGDAEHDVGRAVVYLASKDGRYVTGTTLMVDGGFNYLR